MEKVKKIAIVTTKYGEKGNEWLTNELAMELKSEGYEIYVIALSWLSDDPETNINIESGIKVLRYKMPKLFYSKNKPIKIIKQFTFSIFSLKNIKKHFGDIKFDYVIGFSPAFLTYPIIKYFINRNKAKSFLVLWDFFPYYLIDVGLVKSKLIFKFLKIIENKSYKLFDRIGCMTNKNIEFLYKNYNLNPKTKVEILPIWANIKKIEKKNKEEIRKKYGFSKNDDIFVYGGSHSVIQGLENILLLAKKLENIEKIKIVLIGKGNHKNRLIDYSKKLKLNNLFFLDYIPRDSYEDFISSCDFGIVSLNKNLSVPSFPSKSLDYMKVGLPILASIDENTDYGKILEEEMKCGYYSMAGDVDSLASNAIKLVENRELKIKLGENGRNYYRQKFSVKSICKKITKGVNAND